MNLNNGPSQPTSNQSLECTQTGSLNMPLMGSITSGASAFNMNLNLTGLPPHHLGSSLNTGLVPSSSISSQNMQQSSSSGFPPPPSQFLGNILPSFSSVNSSTVGYGNSSNNGPKGGGSESGSSASSADLGISNSGKSNNLLLSLSSRGRQGTLNSSEEDRDRDDSPMVCVQQSPVASH